MEDEHNLSNKINVLQRMYLYSLNIVTHQNWTQNLTASCFFFSNEGERDMRHVAFDNDAVRSDTLITNDNDWKFIMLIVSLTVKIIFTID